MVATKTKMVKLSGEAAESLEQLHARIQAERGVPITYTQVLGEAVVRWLRSMRDSDTSNGK